MLRSFHPPFTHRYHKCDAEGGNEIDSGIPREKFKENQQLCMSHSRMETVTQPSQNNGHLLTSAEDSRTETCGPKRPTLCALVHTEKEREQGLWVSNQHDGESSPRGTWLTPAAGQFVLSRSTPKV